MSYDIGARIGIDGEKAFQDSIKAINANIKAMGSELKAVTAQFTKNASGEEALTAKNAVLAKSITETKNKIGLLDKQLERQAEKLRDLGRALDEAAKSHGAESEEALKAQNAYNKQAAAVAKLQDQLNGAKAELAGMEGALKENNQAMKEMPGLSDKLGKGLKTGVVAAAKAAAASLAALSAATVAITKSSLDAFSDYEQLTGGVETLFKTSSTTVMQYANDAYKTAGLSANEYMETVTGFSASLLQGLGGDTAKAAELADLAITDMADNANKMGTDMASIQYAYQGFAKQNYTMLDNLKLGYGGTQEEMIRLVNDSGVLNEKIEDLDNVTFDQMIQAIHEVQTQIGITGTTALEAEETIQGSTTAMKSAWENLVTGMASGDQDLGQLAENFTASAETAAKNIIPRIGIILGNIGPMIGEMLKTNLTVNLPEMAKSGVETIGSFVQGLTDGLPNLRESAASLIDGLSSYLAENTQLLISSGLDLISGFASSLRENAGLLVDSGIQLVLSLGQGLADSFPSLIQKLPGIVSDIAGVINDNAPKLLQAGFELIGTLGKGLVQAIPDLLKNLPAITRAIWDTITAINWMNLGKNIIDAFGKGIKSMAVFARNSASNIKDVILKKIKELPSALLNVGKDMIKKLWEGISSMAKWLKDQLGGFISNAINGLTGGSSKSSASSGSGNGRMSVAPAAAAVQSLQRSVSEAETNTRAGAALRQVRRDISSTAGSVAAYYGAPENRNSVRQTGNAGNGITPETLAAAVAAAVKREMSGLAVELDGRPVGRLVSRQQINQGRAMGTL